MTTEPILKSSLRIGNLSIELWWPPQRIRIPAIVAIVRYAPAEGTVYEIEGPVSYLLIYTDKEGFERVLSPGFDITPVARSGMYNMTISRGLVNEFVEALVAFKLSADEINAMRLAFGGEKTSELALSHSIVGNLVDEAGSDKQHSHTLRATLPLNVTMEEIGHLWGDGRGKPAAQDRSGN